MKVRMHTKKDNLKKVQMACKSLNGSVVRVGPTGEHAWLARIHEYGCTIPVTDKMRAYFHHIGVHLRRSTTAIIIPERSFLRAGYDKNRDDVLNAAKELLPDVLFGTLSEKQYLDTVGMTLRDAIKEYAVDLKDPPKKPWPTRDASKNNPLVDTGGMINGIEYEVVK